MTPSRSGWGYYERHAAELARRYESVPVERVHASWLHLLPERPGLALDVGAGSGRDAAWLADRGWEVVAAEPAAAMLDEARRRHPSPRIRWTPDAMPELAQVQSLDFRFDLILAGAVWMHVPPRQRSRAFRKLAGLLRPGGLLVFTLRSGPPDGERKVHDVSPEELYSLGRRHALERVALPREEGPDALGRPGVSWFTVVFRLPDDGTGALPLLRHIVINDPKSSTYKLALLRVLIRIADGARGMVIARDDHAVTLPFGLVALYWLKAFRPLIGAHAVREGRRTVLGRDCLYPQTSNPSLGIGFVREGFLSLRDRSPHDFRVGGRFRGQDARNLVSALRDACANIRRMPATYTTYPGSDRPVFRATTSTVRAAPDTLVVDRDFLGRFGSFEVPAHLWDALSRHACWIEPAVVEEWADLMRRYDEARGKRRSLDAYRRALVWLDPERETKEVRRWVREHLAERKPLFCVWTGRRLNADRFEVDHCFPFACWPNNDLWNLLPASRQANQRKKDRLPSAELLHRARDRIQDWWRNGYGAWGRLERFRTEAFTSLPLAAMLAPSMDQPGKEPAADLWDAVFAGTDHQRVRLRTDQQIEEWEG